VRRSLDPRYREAEPARLDCSKEKETLDKVKQEILILESQIARFESKLEVLEATELANQDSSCPSNGSVYQGSSNCRAGSFNRDAEISRTQREMEKAQQKLGDLEQQERAATADLRCAPAAADE
jgi:predicted  nucleic acid-binding Zn-ribbon protein